MPPVAHESANASSSTSVSADGHRRQGRSADDLPDVIDLSCCDQPEDPLEYDGGLAVIFGGSETQGTLSHAHPFFGLCMHFFAFGKIRIPSLHPLMLQHSHGMHQLHH